jgi:hypothetical protein
MNVSYIGQVVPSDMITQAQTERIASTIPEKVDARRLFRPLSHDPLGWKTNHAGMAAPATAYNFVDMSGTLI